MPSQNPEDQPERYVELTDSQKEILQRWIAENLEPRSTLNRQLSSNGMRNLFESGFPVNIGAVRGAMLAAGYRLVYVKGSGWCFNVRADSINRLLGKSDT